MESASNDDLAQMRKALHSPALGNKDYNSAIDILEVALSAHPERLRERTEIASCFARVGKWGNARKHISVAMKQAPSDPAIASQALQIELQSKNSQQAADIAEIYAPGFLGNSRLADLATTSFYRAKQMDKAAEAARASILLNEGDLDAMSRAAGVLTTAGFASEAVHALEKTSVMASHNAAALFELGRARMGVNKQDPEALEALERAYRFSPENNRISDLRVRAILPNGKAQTAIDILEGRPEALPTSASFKMQHARALRSVGRYGESADLMVALSDAAPENSVLKRQCASALALAGREDAAEARYNDDLDTRAAALPATFAEGLSRIQERLSEAGIPDSRFEWAYRRLEDLGVAPAARAEWEDRVRWINLADHLILDWVECHPEKADQVLDLIDGFVPAIKKVTDTLADGEGAFLVSTHTGAMFAGPPALVASGLDPIWVASTPVIKKGPGAGRILSTSSLSEVKLAKAIVTQVRQGRVVTIAIDGAGVPNLPRRTLFDREIGLSDFVPRTCFRTGTKSFVPISRWEGSRIKTDTVPLPTPISGESKEVFIDRWFEAFIGELVSIFANHPENLRMSGGFWNGINV